MEKILVAVKEPKISLKMLCEYDAASSISRTSIIRDCKFNKPFISARYNEAEDFISEFMAKSIEYPEILHQRSLELIKVGSRLIDMKKDQALSSALALQAFYKMSGKLKRFDGKVLRAEEKHRKIDINGVKVSVRPEIMICDYDGGDYSGFIKFYFGKTKPLTKSIAESMACFGKHYFKEKEGLDFKTKNCVVIDIFAGEIYNAPTSYKRIIQQLTYCCSEIADRWDKIY